MPKSKGRRRPTKQTNAQRQAPSRPVREESGDWSPRTNLIVFAVGTLFVVASALAIVSLFVPGLVATIGSGGFRYVVDPDEVQRPNWPNVIAVFGSLVGFNLVYFCATELQRRRALVAMVTLYSVVFVALGWAAVWVAGADLPAGSLFGPNVRSGAGVIGALAGIGVMITAAGIMLWLESASDFAARRDEYFGTGSARVAVRGIATRPHLVWLAGLLVLWLLTLLPIYLAHWSAGDATGGGQRRWPHPLTDGNELATTAGLLAGAFALLWGSSASFLVQKWLYRGPLADRAAGTSDPLLVARLLARVRHVPFALAAVVLTFALSDAPTGNDSGQVVLVGLATTVLLAALGLLLTSQAWRGRSMVKTTLRIRRAAIAQ